MIKVGILGQNGRMGIAIKHILKDHAKAEFTYGVSRTEGNIGEMLKACDVIIDFSTPLVTLDLCNQNINLRKPLVIGTTGFSDVELLKLDDLATEMPILWSSNMSMGVNIVADIVQKLGNKLDETWDIEIVEEHHNKKVDSPSGTALLLGKKVAHGREVKLADVMICGRDGIDKPRQSGQIGFSSVRCGNVIGDHKVIFDNGFERIEVRHYAYTRNIFAKGAVDIAIGFFNNRPSAGKIYSFHDVL